MEFYLAFYVVTHGDFGPVSTKNSIEDGYYIVKFNSDTFIIQEYVIIYGINTAICEQVSNAFYLSCMKQG